MKNDVSKQRISCDGYKYAIVICKRKKKYSLKSFHFTVKVFLIHRLEIRQLQNFELLICVTFMTQSVMRSFGGMTILVEVDGIFQMGLQRLIVIAILEEKYISISSSHSGKPNKYYGFYLLLTEENPLYCWHFWQIQEFLCTNRTQSLLLQNQQFTRIGRSL